MFSEAKSRRQYRVVADQIRDLIRADGLRPGQRLPSERDLAEQMNLSRPSLREALIALEVEGVVEIRMGSGVYVREGGGDPLSASDPDGEGPLELLRARCIIESGIAEEAARLATPALITRLDTLLEGMADAVHDRQLAIRLDGSFHVEIAQATGNSVLAKLTADTFQRRLTPIFEQFSNHFENPESWQRATTEHRLIRDALAARDPAAARNAMNQHLSASHRRFSESLSAEPGAPGG